MARVLVDTAVWIDHLHAALPELFTLLRDDRVCTHPMIIGELALGSIKNRSTVIDLLSNLGGVTRATDQEVLNLIEARTLPGKGLSLVDVHLLASTLLTPDTVLWTRDKRLRAVATEFGVSAG